MRYIGVVPDHILTGNPYSAISRLTEGRVVSAR